ncbi:MAG: hypothetical protein HQM08_14155 [Candidatus Riflebacteria bacterium]|nr:hypothetical protein [Candidatus Riflebacteria bacterium]
MASTDNYSKRGSPANKGIATISALFIMGILSVAYFATTFLSRSQTQTPGDSPSQKALFS